MGLTDHLDKLHAFKVILESGTMRKASQTLHLTQPSLTRLVQTLEDAAGTRLMSRGRHGVIPTEAGKLLLQYSDSVLNGLWNLEEQIKNPSNPLAGHLRVGAYASLAEYLWPDFIPMFKKEAPALRLSIRTSETVNHQKALEQGKIDVLVDAESRIAGDLISWSLYEDRFNFYSAKPGAWDPDTIGSLPLIYSPAAFDRENKGIVQHLEEAGYFFKETIELDSFTSVMAFARKGLGLAVLPRRLAENPVSAGHLKVASLKHFAGKGFGAHTFTATVLENRKDDTKIRFFIKSLKAWFKL